jgi:hypothetical protein
LGDIHSYRRDEASLSGDCPVKKLPARYHRFALPLGTSFFMAFLVSGVATYRVLGWDKAMLESWMPSWMIAWAIAAPTMYFASGAPRPRPNHRGGVGRGLTRAVCSATSGSSGQ